MLWKKSSAHHDKAESKCDSKTFKVITRRLVRNQQVVQVSRWEECLDSFLLLSFFWSKLWFSWFLKPVSNISSDHSHSEHVLPHSLAPWPLSATSVQEQEVNVTAQCLNPSDQVFCKFSLNVL